MLDGWEVRSYMIISSSRLCSMGLVDYVPSNDMKWNWFYSPGSQKAYGTWSELHQDDVKEANSVE